MTDPITSSIEEEEINPELSAQQAVSATPLDEDLGIVHTCVATTRTFSTQQVNTGSLLAKDGTVFMRNPATGSVHIMFRNQTPTQNQISGARCYGTMVGFKNPTAILNSVGLIETGGVWYSNAINCSPMTSQVSDTVVLSMVWYD